MVAAAVIGGVAALGGGAIAASGAKSAGKAQERAAREANVAQQRMFEEQNRLQEPFRQGGLTAQNEIMQLLGIGGDKAAASYGSLGKSFGMADFEQDPGYAFRQAEGMKALQRSASARSMLESGANLKGITRFGQNLASEEYQNAFNRYQINRSNKLNPLQSLMGSGQSATNVMTGAAGQAGQNQASNIYNAGQARASGYVGQANALSNALGQVGAIAQQVPMNNAMIGYYNRAPAGSLQGGSSGGGGGSAQYNPFAYNPDRLI